MREPGNLAELFTRRVPRPSSRGVPREFKVVLHLKILKKSIFFFDFSILYAILNTYKKV